MTRHLRRLSVFVDEPEDGHFYWVIIESKEDAAVWEDVEASDEPVHSWKEAWDAGCSALLKMVSDPVKGPLTSGEDESADPVG